MSFLCGTPDSQIENLCAVAHPKENGLSSTIRIQTACSEPKVSCPKPPSFWVLAVGSVGVVYGDIGTSPLYAMHEALGAAAGASGEAGGVPVEAVYGVASLIIWALILVVTVKYVVILLNADNKGEGGTLSLMALAQRVMRSRLGFIPVLAMIGAALF